MKKLLLVSLLLMPVGVMASMPDAPDTDVAASAPTTDVKPVLVNSGKLKLMPVTLQQKTKNYTLRVHYPQIMGTPSNGSAANFNKLIDTTIQQRIEAFKKAVSDNNANTALPANMPKRANYLAISYTMNGFDSQSQQTEYVSVRFNIESYLRGMAHPSKEVLTFNYDLGHDQQLALSDLFKPDAHYLSTISDYVIGQLKQKKLPAQMVMQGAAAKPENYKNWNLTLDGLSITFNPAQVAPSVYGNVEVVVPKAVLENIVTHPTACTLSFINCDGT